MNDNNNEQVKKGKRNILFPILLVIFSLGLILSGYKTISIIYEDRHSGASYNELREQLRVNVTDEGSIKVEKIASDSDGKPKRRQSMDIKQLRESYPQIKGWILSEGTGIDYPIVQTGDNDYYLTHLYDGTTNSNGAIFLDYRNKGLCTDDNTVIYGHHMKSNTMFHSLLEYKDQDFYKAHPTMMIYTEDGDYLVELICGTVEDGAYEFVRFSFDDFDDMTDYVDKLKKRSTFKSEVELLEGDKLISLCTCTYERENARYMVLGKVTELYE